MHAGTMITCSGTISGISRACMRAGLAGWVTAVVLATLATTTHEQYTYYVPILPAASGHTIKCQGGVLGVLLLFHLPRV